MQPSSSPHHSDFHVGQNVFRSTASRRLDGRDGQYKNSMHITFQKIIATGPDSISYIQRYLVMVKDALERELKTNEKLGHLQEWYYWRKPGSEAVKSLIDVDYIGGFKSLRILGSPKLKYVETNVEDEGKKKRVVMDHWKPNVEAPPLRKCDPGGIVVEGASVTKEDFLYSLLTGPVSEGAIDLTQLIDPPRPFRCVQQGEEVKKEVPREKKSEGSWTSEERKKLQELAQQSLLYQGDITTQVDQTRTHS